MAVMHLHKRGGPGLADAWIFTVHVRDALVFSVFTVVLAVGGCLLSLAGVDTPPPWAAIEPGTSSSGVRCMQLEVRNLC